MEYLSNHWSDLTQILNLRYGDQSNDLQKPQMKTTLIGREPLNGRWPEIAIKLQMKVQRDNLYELLEEISSVALLSPACFLSFFATFLLDPQRTIPLEK
jgi:hypothetical protein